MHSRRRCTRRFLLVTLRTLFLAAGLAFAGAATWAFIELQPERRLEKRFLHWVEAGERRDWKAVAERLAPDYRDGWGHDKSAALEAAREVFGQFVVLGIEVEPLRITRDGDFATIATRPRLSGNGSPLVPLIIRHANELPSDTLFRWRRQSWLPWDWVLVSVSNPDVSAGARHGGGGALTFMR